MGVWAVIECWAWVTCWGEVLSSVCAKQGASLFLGSPSVLPLSVPQEMATFTTVTLLAMEPMGLSAFRAVCAGLRVVPKGH